MVYLVMVNCCKKLAGNINELLTVRLIEEVEFLREELRGRREDFMQREKSLQEIINILNVERPTYSHSALGPVVENEFHQPPVVENEFHQPPGKHTTRKNRINNTHVNPLSTSNRFDSLAVDASEIHSGDPLTNSSSQVLTNTSNVDANKIQSDDLSTSSLPQVPTDMSNVTKRKRKSQKNAQKDSHASEAQQKQNQSVSQQNRQDSRTEQTKRTIPRKEIVILGDSMLKDIKGWRMSRTHNITSHSLSGCNNHQLLHMCRALCERKPQPDLVLVHCGTNSLFPKSGRDTQNSTTAPMSPTEVVNSIKSCFETLKSEYPTVKLIFSNLITRNDRGDDGKRKVSETNDLIEACDVTHISHGNIDESHLNTSKLHLNKSGASVLAQNYINFIKAYDFG